MSVARRRSEDAAPEPTDSPPQLTRRERLVLRRRDRKRSAFEWVVVIVAAVVIAVLLRAFVVQTFYIPSGSMEPTLRKNDRVVVNKLSYHLHSVHRGDIVVFTTPPGVNKSFKDLVKRVVGLPGERIAIRRGVVMVNGKALIESYAHGQDISLWNEIVLGDDEFFVVGDNRDISVFFTVHRNQILGRALL